MKGEISMKGLLKLLSVLVLLVGLTGIAQAYTIDTTFIAVGNQYTSPFEATVADFDITSPWSWVGSFDIVSGSADGLYSAPGGVDGINKDTTNYVTVPFPTPGITGNGFVEVTGLPTSNYFGLWWGSIDTYNTFSFTFNGLSTGESVTGSTVLGIGTPSGNQLAAGSNHYVNFLGLQDFNGFVMASTQYAFEADNIAIGFNPSRVPEPTTMLLLGLGLVGLVGVRRKFQK